VSTSKLTANRERVFPFRSQSTYTRYGQFTQAPTRTRRATRHPTIDPYSVPFLRHPRRILTPIFSGTLARHSTFGTTTHNTSTMTHHYHPHPSRDSGATLNATSAYQASLNAEENPQVLSSWAGGSPYFASLARPSASPVPPLRYVAIIFLPYTMEATWTRALC